MPRPCKILIIDDNINDFSLCADILQRLMPEEDNNENLQVIHAAGTEEGLALIATAQPNLVLLDCPSSETNRLETLINIQNISADLPIVL